MGLPWRLSNRRLGSLLAALLICEVFLLAAFWSVKGLLDKEVPVHESTMVTLATIILVPAVALLLLAIGRYVWRRRFTLRQMFLLLVLVAVVLGSGRVLFKTAVRHYVVSRLHGPGLLTDFDMLLIGDELSDRTSLDLHGRQITDTGIERLAPAPQLQTLDLMSTSISDAALSHLGRLPNLRFLYLDNNNITDDGLSYLADIPKLTSLILTQTRISDRGIAKLGSLPNLRRLVLPKQITDQGMEGLGRSSSIEFVGLSNTAVGDRGMKYLSRCETITHLELTHTSVTDEGLRHLSKLPNLKRLFLGSCTGVTDKGMQFVARMERLKDISLIGTQVGDAGLKQLAAVRTLETISISDQVTDDGLKNLIGLPKLRYIWLGAGITDAGFEHVARMRHLTDVGVSRAKVSDDAVKRLKELLPDIYIGRY